MFRNARQWLEANGWITFALFAFSFCAAYVIACSLCAGQELVKGEAISGVLWLIVAGGCGAGAMSLGYSILQWVAAQQQQEMERQKRSHHRWRDHDIYLN